MKGQTYWVIKSKKQNSLDIFSNKARSYFASRTSIKNKRYTTTLHYHVKWFATKKEAEDFYFRKARQGFDLHEYVVARKKIYVDRKGNYDYWENRRSLML